MLVMRTSQHAYRNCQVKQGYSHDMCCTWPAVAKHVQVGACAVWSGGCHTGTEPPIPGSGCKPTQTGPACATPLHLLLEPNLSWSDAICASQGPPLHGLDPTWSVVLLGIRTFVLQYAASGSLEAPLLGQTFGPVPQLDVLLCTTGVLQWYTFDRSLQGTSMQAPTVLLSELPWLRVTWVVAS